MNMNKKSGLLPTMIGLLLIAAALILAYIWDGTQAKKASDEIMEKLEDVMEEKELSIPVYDSANKGMPSEEIGGWLYIGILDIPSLGLHLPVMQDWDMTLFTCNLDGQTRCAVRCVQVQ